MTLSGCGHKPRLSSNLSHIARWLRVITFTIHEALVFLSRPSARLQPLSFLTVLLHIYYLTYINFKKAAVRSPLKQRQITQITSLGRLEKYGIITIV